MLDDFDEEAPRYRKKSKKHHVKSDHKHEYEMVCIDAHTEIITREEKSPSYHIGNHCKVCGRLHDLKTWATSEIPREMPLYEIEDFFELYEMKILPDENRLTEMRH